MNSAAERSDRTRIVLIHGGLAENMDAHRFWTQPGIVPALQQLGYGVLAPDRDTTPSSWQAAAAAMAERIDMPATVVAGSNGVSVAIRLALDFPMLVARLVLLWPASAGIADIDAHVPDAARHLLAGETVRGASDEELRRLAIPVAVMASRPETASHRHSTVDRLVNLIPRARRIDESFPESPVPGFSESLDKFVAALVPHL